jgi:hypothetical protein
MVGDPRSGIQKKLISDPDPGLKKYRDHIRILYRIGALFLTKALKGPLYEAIYR